MGDKRTSNAKRMAEYTKRLRKQVLEILGGKCARCGFDDPRALQVDHISGGGTREKAKIGSHAIWRKIVKDPEARKEYRLLCANCNWIKRAEHRKERGGNPRPQTSLTKATAICQQCGKEFTYNPSGRPPRKFCSVACFGEHQRKPETRRKMSEVHKGHTVSRETRAKISESLKGRTHPSKII